MQIWCCVQIWNNICTQRCVQICPVIFAMHWLNDKYFDIANLLQANMEFFSCCCGLYGIIRLQVAGEYFYIRPQVKTLQSCKKKALFPINQYYLLLISKGLVTNISLVKINSKPWQYNSFCQYIEDNILSPAQRLGKMTVDLTVACKGWIFRHFPDKSDFLMIIFIHWRFAIMDYKVENNKMKEWQ